MSFISSMFGAKNTFTPTNPYGDAKPTLENNDTLLAQVGTANGNYGNANTGLQSLAQSLQQQAMGGGPNLANAQLQQATGQNVSNQAALQAGQRGASSNVGLMARQIGQQGAGIQQQAAGQSAQNVLAQQLAAQQQLGGVLTNQGSLANQYHQISDQAIANQNAGIAGAQNNVNQINANVASQQAQQGQGLLSGIGNIAGSLVSPLANSIFGGPSKPAQANSAGGGQMNPNMMYAAEGGEVPSFHSNFLNKHTQHFAQGGPVQGLHFGPVDFKKGGQVPGKPQVQGNSPKNDTVPAMLSPQEIVIPNSVTQSKDPVGNGAKFIEDTLRKKLGSRK